MSTNIKVGVVESNFDVLELGRIYVVVDEIDPNKGIEVQYSSPYLTGNKGGFVAIPDVGTPVIICKPDKQSKWYYLASVVESVARYAGTTGNQSLEENQDWIPEGHTNYIYAGHPQQLLLKTPKGNALRLCDLGNNESNKIKAELESSLGKRLCLDDSPEVDAVILEDRNGNAVRIYSQEGQIYVTAINSVVVSSAKSNVDIECINGKEINIKNHSTGDKRSGDTDSSPGNINIESDWGDLNLNVKSKDGAVFIKAEGSNSTVVLEANNITIKARNQLDIEGTNALNIQSDGIVTIKGAQVHLNP